MYHRTWTLLGVLLLVLAACGPAATATPVPTRAPTAAPTSALAPAGYANPQFLVESDWLAQHLNDADLRVVDVRAAEKYQEGHVPGALNLALAQVTITQPVTGMAAPPEKFAEVMGSLGIGNNSRVVIYDDNALSAARLFWLLDYYGHQQVSLLNGGYPKWAAENREVTKIATRTTPGSFTAQADPNKVATKQDVLDRLNNPGIAVVDARTPKEYTGEDVRSARGGRIPGAVNINWTDTLVPQTAVFKPASELRDMLSKAGVTPDKEAISYCQTGVRAAVDYLVLRLLGYPKVRNYDGSWVEWGNDPNTPIEK
ncbi:MAG: sulfurtransferase [Chloroflexi bacterium]|nr:sulfurtransferase [Chloroflexota bacterium]